MARITRLSLVNYRNFREVDIAPPAGVSVFHGGNAQGKTSLLEAAYTLAVGRSFRTERERQVLNFDAARDGGAAYITGTACVDGKSLTVVIGYQPTGARVRCEWR
ncbi:DNA replication and repair protein RecF [Geodia barretti]|uniref:DNA replication and repair protein RecF n=1 Tax=Geodia barretti TaxID=519541 RepID=A0AA35XCD3_GEOBA|nr:DNA replication and repair protein RecF [Geodia barretti]